MNHAVLSLPDRLPVWLVDVVLIGLGAGLVVLGTVQSGLFGDGMVVGAGLLAVGAGVRGLVVQA